MPSKVHLWSSIRVIVQALIIPQRCFCRIYPLGVNLAVPGILMFNLSNDLNAVQCHVIKKYGMEQVAVMGHGGEVF